MPVHVNIMFYKLKYNRFNLSPFFEAHGGYCILVIKRMILLRVFFIHPHMQPEKG